jgi:hypothetical protein
MFLDYLHKCRPWPEKFTRLRRAAGLIEKKTLKKRITNIESSSGGLVSKE